MLSSSTGRNPTTSQPIQCGTKRPLGKRQKTRKSRRKARNSRTWAATCPASVLTLTTPDRLSAPCTTSMSATSRAIQLSDLRQKSRTPIATQTKALVPLRATLQTASLPPGSCCSCTTANGKPTTTRPKVRATRSIQPTRAKTRNPPDKRVSPSLVGSVRMVTGVGVTGRGIPFLLLCPASARQQAASCWSASPRLMYRASPDGCLFPSSSIA